MIVYPAAELSTFTNDYIGQLLTQIQEKLATPNNNQTTISELTEARTELQTELNKRTAAGGGSINYVVATNAVNQKTPAPANQAVALGVGEIILFIGLAALILISLNTNRKLKGL